MTTTNRYTFCLATPDSDNNTDVPSPAAGTVGIFNKDGILVEEFPATRDDHLTPAKVAILDLLEAGSTSGQVQQTYAAPKSKSEIQQALEISTPIRNLFMMQILNKMMDTNAGSSEVLVVNDNCHSAALLGHCTMLELERFQIDRYSGRGDDFPTLTMTRDDFARTMGVQPSPDMEFATSNSRDGACRHSWKCFECLRSQRTQWQSSKR